MKQKDYSKNIIATLCYVMKGKKVLMLHRVKKENDIHYGKYNGLGGKARHTETPLECVIREVKEESGLLIKEPVLKGIIRFPYFDGTNTWTVFVYRADKFSGKISVCNEGDLVWIDIKDLNKINLWEGDRYFLKYVFDKKSFFYAIFYYRDFRLIDYRIEVL